MDAIDNLKISEQQVREKDGLWYSMTIYPYKTIENKIDGAVITLFDISEIKMVKEKIEAVGEYFKNIVETISEPLIILDENLRVKSANKSFYKTFKISSHETEGQLFYKMDNHQWNIPALQKLIKGVASKNTSISDVEIHHNFLNIGEKTILVSARKLSETVIKEELILIGIKDITGRSKMEIALKEAKAKAENANKSKSEFLANVSHDLRTPLNAIVGFCSLLSSELPVEQRSRMIEIIQHESKSVLSLINEILDMSKLEAGKIELRKDEFILEEIVNLAVDSLRIVSSAKNILINCSIFGRCE